jgi:3-hydroxyisobutyrate dehydrogenase-like beta-hydroxyacid dehydrogenase
VGCELVFACVGNDDDLRSVVLGPNGAFAGMGKGAIFVVAVDWMRKDLSICFDEARSGFPFAKIAPLPWKLLRPLFLHLGLLSLRS